MINLPATIAKRDLIRVIAADPDSDFNYIALDLGLFLAGTKPAAYFMEHENGPKFARVWEVIRERGWGLVDQFPAPDYTEFLAALGITEDPWAGKDVVSEIISPDQALNDELKRLITRAGLDGHTAAEEREGVLLGYPWTSAHWFGYHRLVEGAGDVSAWSDDELLFGKGVHPKDPAGLALAQAWAQGRAKAFIEAYGREALANFRVDRPDPKKPDEGLTEVFGRPEGYVSSANCPRCHPRVM